MRAATAKKGAARPLNPVHVDEPKVGLLTRAVGWSAWPRRSRRMQRRRSGVIRRRRLGQAGPTRAIAAAPGDEQLCGSERAAGHARILTLPGDRIRKGTARAPDGTIFPPIQVGS
jgi:hypothetical protein